MLLYVHVMLSLPALEMMYKLFANMEHPQIKECNQQPFWPFSNIEKSKLTSFRY